MSIKYQAQDIDEQMARLKLVFPDEAAIINIYMSKPNNNQIRFLYSAEVACLTHDEWVSSGINRTPKRAVDLMLQAAGISKVEEYIRLNRNRFGGML